MPICDRNALTIVARLEVRGEEREELMMQRCVVREVGQQGQLRAMREMREVLLHIQHRLVTRMRTLIA